MPHKSGSPTVLRLTVRAAHASPSALGRDEVDGRAACEQEPRRAPSKCPYKMVCQYSRPCPASSGKHATLTGTTGAGAGGGGTAADPPPRRVVVRTPP
jgi:hypothetical protein